VKNIEERVENIEDDVMKCNIDNRKGYNYTLEIFRFLRVGLDSW